MLTLAEVSVHGLFDLPLSSPSCCPLQQNQQQLCC